MKQYLVISILLIYNSTYAQVGGENVFNFLNVSTSARQAALGGEVLTQMFPHIK